MFNRATKLCSQFQLDFYKISSARLCHLRRLSHECHDNKEIHSLDMLAPDKIQTVTSSSHTVTPRRPFSSAKASSKKYLNTLFLSYCCRSHQGNMTQAKRKGRKRTVLYLLRLMRPPNMDPLSKASFHLNGICISDAGILDSSATIWS